MYQLSFASGQTLLRILQLFNHTRIKRASDTFQEILLARPGKIIIGYPTIEELLAAQNFSEVDPRLPSTKTYLKLAGAIMSKVEPVITFPQTMSEYLKQQGIPLKAPKPPKNYSTTVAKLNKRAYPEIKNKRHKKGNR